MHYDLRVTNYDIRITLYFVSLRLRGKKIIKFPLNISPNMV
jgi:hypothetical protein